MATLVHYDRGNGVYIDEETNHRSERTFFRRLLHCIVYHRECRAADHLHTSTIDGDAVSWDQIINFEAAVSLAVPRMKH